MKREERVTKGLSACKENLKHIDSFSKDVIYGRPIERKVLKSIEEAIYACGLKDGMTVSFHHAFRNGDFTLKLVMDIIADMGIKNLTIAPSSLTRSHNSLIEHIKSGVVTKIYTSGIRDELADEISNGLLENPVHIHSHGGRVHLIKSGELEIDVTFLGVPVSDVFGNANGQQGRSICGSLGYAATDAKYANKVVLLTEKFIDFPNPINSISQDQVDYIVKVDVIGDPSKIGGGATRMTKNPRELLIAKRCADLIEKSGYFVDGFSLQTGSGGASLAVTRFLEDKMIKAGITASFGLGGITATMVDLNKKGLIKTLLDVQSFDSIAAESLAGNPNHVEITANQYANYSSKGALVEKLDIVILSALEIDKNFNVNVITGSDGVLRGASGGHSDTAANARLAIIVAPLVRGRIPTVVDDVITCITPGKHIDILITDHGIAVNPNRPNLKKRLEEQGIQLTTIEDLQKRAYALTGKPKKIKFKDKPVAIIRYRDGCVIDTVYQVEK